MMKQGIMWRINCHWNQGKFRMALEFDKNISLEQNNLVSGKIENYILQQPEVESVFSNVGGPSTGIGSLGVGSANKTEFTVQLKSKEDIQNISTSIYRDLRTNLEKDFSGINFFL